MSEQMESFKFGEITKEEFIKIHAVRMTILFASQFKAFFSNLAMVILTKKLPSLFGMSVPGAVKGFMPNTAGFKPEMTMHPMISQGAANDAQLLLSCLDAYVAAIQSSDSLKPYYQKAMEMSEMIYDTYISTGTFNAIMPIEISYSHSPSPVDAAWPAPNSSFLGVVNCFEKEKMEVTQPSDDQMNPST